MTNSWRDLPSNRYPPYPTRDDAQIDYDFRERWVWRWVAHERLTDGEIRGKWLMLDEPLAPIDLDDMIARVRHAFARVSYLGLPPSPGFNPVGAARFVWGAKDDDEQGDES